LNSLQYVQDELVNFYLQAWVLVEKIRECQELLNDCLKNSFLQQIFLTVFQENLGDSKYKVGIGVFGSLFLAAEKCFDTSLLLIFQELDEIPSLTNDIFLEYLVNKWLILRLILALYDNPLE
jgi:hypothetical protein